MNVSRGCAPRGHRLPTIGVLALAIAGCPVAPTSTNLCDQPGVICTIAGTGRSQFDGDGRPASRTSFYFPTDVEFDSLGRPLILDSNNQRIRRINSDTSVQTIIGVGEEDSPTDGALAADTPLHHATDLAPDSAGRIYIAGGHAPVVFRIDTDDRVDLVAGSGEFGNDGDGDPALSARLSGPYGVLPLGDGAFYVSDIEVDVVRFVDAEGSISTVAGTGARGYTGDGGSATLAQLSGPGHLARDAQGDLYICDVNNHVIRRFTADGTLTTFAGSGVAGFSGAGGPAVNATLNTPSDLRFASNGDLFVADTGNNVIRRIDRAGHITTVVGTGTVGFAGDEGAASACRLNAPSGVNFDAQGNMWIADTLNQRVRRVAGFLDEAK